MWSNSTILGSCKTWQHGAAQAHGLGLIEGSKEPANVDRLTGLRRECPQLRVVGQMDDFIIHLG